MDTGSFVFEIVPERVKLIPFLNRHAVVRVPSLVWAVDQAVNGVAVVLQICQPRVMVLVLMGYENTT